MGLGFRVVAMGSGVETVTQHSFLLSGGDLVDCCTVLELLFVTTGLTASSGSSGSCRNVRVCNRHVVGKGSRDGRWTRPHAMGDIRVQEFRTSEQTKGTGCCD